jgi:hypothetical protein
LARHPLGLFFTRARHEIGLIQHVGRDVPEPIHYCATDDEMPLFEPCKDKKDQRDYLMTATNQIFLVMDAGTPVAAFTARPELKAYLRRRLDTFINPLLYTF